MYDRSNVDPVPEAHRCGSHHYIYDPCFGGFQTQLLEEITDGAGSSQNSLVLATP
jgi:hypothetical protein